MSRTSNPSPQPLRQSATTATSRTCRRLSCWWCSRAWSSHLWWREAHRLPKSMASQAGVTGSSRSSKDMARARARARAVQSPPERQPSSLQLVSWLGIFPCQICRSRCIIPKMPRFCATQLPSGVLSESATAAVNTVASVRPSGVVRRPSLL